MSAYLLKQNISLFVKTKETLIQSFEYQLIKLKEEILDKGYLYYNFDW